MENISPSIPQQFRKPRILVAASGCECASEFTKLCTLLTNWADVIAISTKTAEKFFDSVAMPLNLRYYTDTHEWIRWTKIGDPIMHIQLSQWADMMVIAPLSANTLAKISNGLCDNLVTCIVRAWDYEKKQMFLAPSMCKGMWDNELTEKQLSIVDELGVAMIRPDNGKMAAVDLICASVMEFYKNYRALGKCMR